ncbi:hypothetical protein [Pseudidiomarina insulisalsae]|uniref:Uncharacterized protein n=1 Tax=Pseudidiomarina insulisalsae TaxID=575789 RepID=A0A432YF22_9GAMM|nr:hypothetical protein [Pseudidiomarina insulisalsae]RUO59553.1 hypothetical protein CWI71_09045 [Pseudidiomarina insulisalsae]
MKKILILGVLALSFFSASAHSCSFRIKGGDLIRCGMTKIEVMDKIGQPNLRDKILYTSIKINNTLLHKTTIITTRFLQKVQMSAQRGTRRVMPIILLAEALSGCWTV